MSAQHPTPWRAEGRDNGKRGRLRREFWSILDRNGFFVAEGLDERTAREIVDAVNERTQEGRDRLRDIVRRTVETLEQIYKHADMTDYLRADVAGMQREASAALGEDRK